MIIRRMIGETEHEFELTDNELFNAYEEQKLRYLERDIRDSLDGIGDAAKDIAIEVEHQMSMTGCLFETALDNVIEQFKDDLKEDRIEYLNMQVRLKNHQYTRRMEKRNLEFNTSAIKAYWGKYLSEECEL